MTFSKFKREHEQVLELTSFTFSASSFIVNSPGFPILIGPVLLPSISRMRPSTLQQLEKRQRHESSQVNKHELM